MTWIRPFAVQAITVLLTLLLVRWIAKRASRADPLLDGWNIVQWGPQMRWLSIILCVMMLGAGFVLIPAVARAPAALALIVSVIALPVYGAIYCWRNWLEYKDDVLIVNTTWKGRQTLRLSDLSFTGAVGPRGHEYTTSTGDTIYINSYQHGANNLIKLLSSRESGI
jgi:hypothetical protein